MTTDKFYFIRDGKQVGPMEAEQLAQENITPQTMVWRQGLEDWKEARLLPELDFLWKNTNAGGETPPSYSQTSSGWQQSSPYGQAPYAGYNNGNIPPQCPPTYLAWSIVVTLLCFWPLGIPAIINASRVEKDFLRGDYAAAERHSKAARSWSIASAACALILFVIYLVFAMFAIFTQGLY